jgi:hypothetical protein
MVGSICVIKSFASCFDLRDFPKNPLDLKITSTDKKENAIVISAIKYTKSTYATNIQQYLLEIIRYEFVSKFVFYIILLLIAIDVTQTPRITTIIGMHDVN